jgi:restriction endonuclease S subunit
MKTILNTITLIQSGVFAVSSTQGDTLYLQSSQIDELGIITRNLQSMVLLEPRLKKYLLQDKDILFSAKGIRNSAVCFDARMGAAVASTTFLVLKVQSASVLPEFVAWFLNHPSTQATLKAQARGASPPSITKDVLQHLQIDVPSLQRQEEILQIHSLWKKEQNLLRMINELKAQEIQSLLIQSAKG